MWFLPRWKQRLSSKSRSGSRRISEGESPQRRPLELVVASDIHVEFQEDRGEAFFAKMPEGDVLVCAGDLGNASTYADALERLCQRYRHVVYVMGNHEAYGSSISAVRRTLGAMDEDLKELHYLENSTCEIDGQRFVGATLWTPRTPASEAVEFMVNDFHLIADAPDAIYTENVRALRWLRKNIRRDDVVVTHHLPSPRSTHPRHSESPINCFFVCDMEVLIAKRQPRLWIHGHTHDSMDYAIGETRVVCNPYGYQGYEPNPEYDASLTLSI